MENNRTEIENYRKIYSNLTLKKNQKILRTNTFFVPDYQVYKGKRMQDLNFRKKRPEIYMNLEKRKERTKKIDEHTQKKINEAKEYIRQRENGEFDQTHKNNLNAWV